MAQISVIVPVYNNELFLRRCVDSIFRQTFQDFELILVDDGSSDQSGKICDEYAMADDKVRVIHRQNGGLSVARNAGINWAFINSSSQWLAFIDSDDWIHPQYLEYLYRAARENHVQISICNYQNTEMFAAAEEQPYEATIWNWSEILVKNNVQAVIACNKLYAKHLFSGLRYPVGKIHEDEFVTYKVLHRADTVAYIPAELYYYFRNEHSITNDRFSIKRLDCADALLERIHYVHGLDNEELMAFCVRQFLRYCWRMTPVLKSADWISSSIRKKKEKEIRRAFKKVLIQYGMRYTPPWRNGEYYDFAFPFLYNNARKCVRFIRRRGTRK